MKRLSFIFLTLLCMVFTIGAQNVGINDDGSTANSSAMLDVNSTTKGILIPRVALTATNTAGPVTNPATGLMVYNTANAGTAPNDVTPGFYYWDSSKWFSLRDGLSTAPYGSYYDLSTQTTTDANTAFPITFNTNDAQYGFTHSTSTNPSRIYATYAGKYLITFSGIFQTTNANKSFNVWLRVNGSDYANSSTDFGVPTTGSLGNRVVTVTYIVPLTAGQYFEVVMWSNDTAGKLIYTAAQSSPSRPACPSIILTVNKISN